MSFGKRRYFSVNEIKGRQRRVFFHQVIVRSVADQPRHFFRLNAFQRQLFPEQSHRQTAIRSDRRIIGFKADASDVHGQVVAVALESVVERSRGFIDRLRTGSGSGKHYQITKKHRCGDFLLDAL